MTPTITFTQFIREVNSMSHMPITATKTDRFSSGSAEAVPRAVLGLRGVIALIVGVVIGAGIFKAPAMVAGMTGNTTWMFGAWVLGLIGLVFVINTAVYARVFPIRFRRDRQA